MIQGVIAQLIASALKLTMGKGVFVEHGAGDKNIIVKLTTDIPVLKGEDDVNVGRARFQVLLRGYDVNSGFTTGRQIANLLVPFTSDSTTYKTEAYKVHWIAIYSLPTHFQYEGVHYHSLNGEIAYTAL